MAASYRLILVAPFLLAALACADAGGGSSGGGGGTPSSSGGSGTIATGGGGAKASVPLAGSGQAIGDGDQGQQFNAGDVVAIMAETGGMMNAGGSGGSGGSAIPGDGHMMTATMRRGVSGTADFTQAGEDVTMVLNLTSGCADGKHTLTIHDGYACDAAITEGVVWGARGAGIGPDGGFTCTGGKATLTYTRTGADKTKNWTVADHAQGTDVTNHVLIMDSGGDARAICGNFF